MLLRPSVHFTQFPPSLRVSSINTDNVIFCANEMLHFCADPANTTGTSVQLSMF